MVITSTSILLEGQDRHCMHLAYAPTTFRIIVVVTCEVRACCPFKEVWAGVGELCMIRVLAFRAGSRRGSTSCTHICINAHFYCLSDSQATKHTVLHSERCICWTQMKWTTPSVAANLRNPSRILFHCAAESRDRTGDLDNPGN